MLIKLSELCTKYNFKPKNIIHVGAHYAEEIADYYAAGAESTLWIEANPFLISVLENNINKYSNAKAIIACLSDKEQELNFNIANNGQSSSMLDLAYHKTAHPEVNYTGTISVNTKTLDSVLEELGYPFDHFDFLNADIQGAELLMLKGAKETIKHLKYLYLEVNNKPMYEGCAQIGEIDEFLLNAGFMRVELEWCFDFGWGDAFYVKNGENIFP